MAIAKFRGHAPKLKRPPYTGTREIVLVEAERCPRCSADVHDAEQIEPALIRHGGYGAARRTISRACACGWRTIVDRTDVHPRTQVGAA